MSAALTIARFCWPDGTWKLRAGTPGEPAAVRVDHLGSPVLESPVHEPGVWTHFSETNLHDIAAAEVRIVELGLRAAYGRALLDHFGHYVAARGKELELLAVDLAVAPSDVRVKAMLAVIEFAKPA